jgi:AGCS family alanine or glycine:cation symporter
MSFDAAIDETFKPVADFVSGIVFCSVPVMGLDVKLILIWLVLPALFFTVYLSFVNFRYFGKAFSLLFDKNLTQRGEGEIGSFHALAASLSGTVGLGNIAGVAVAVSIGGPGATIWMILMGLLSMATKYAEVFLGIKYRRMSYESGSCVVDGGPMYYLKEAFNQRNMPMFGSFMAGFFAMCCIAGAIGGGNMFQANQTFQQVINVTGGADSFIIGYGWAFGLLQAALVGIVIIGGIKSIARVASVLVPLMGGVYLLAGAIVLAIFYQNIPSAFLTIFESAFSMEAGLGGLLGGLLVGVQRAVFSNEAGLGSAAVVHSAVKTESPVAQAIIAMQGPFIDTVIICTMTALVIVVTGAYQNSAGVEGVTLTSNAFAAGISWFPYVLAFTVFLFAYSTIITWYYYGEKALCYLVGQNSSTILAFKIFFCGVVVLGSSTNLSNIISFTDAMILSMGIPNIIGLYLLAPEIRRDLKAYAKAQQQKA